MDGFMSRHVGASPGELNSYWMNFICLTQLGAWPSGEEMLSKGPDGPGWRDQALAGMYDAQMIATSVISDEQA